MTVETMESRLVKLLRRGWVTPQEALRRVGCFSLAQRVSELQREKGLRVEKRWVTVCGHRVMSYRAAQRQAVSDIT